MPLSYDKWPNSRFGKRLRYCKPVLPPVAHRCLGADLLLIKELSVSFDLIFRKANGFLFIHQHK